MTPPRRQAPGETRSLAILVVEDEGIVAADIEMKLRRMGYTVPASARTGDAAVAAAERHRPDLVLMDINLQGEMDGVEAATKIRALLDIPIVFLTGNADRPTLERAKVAEPQGYVLKPFSDRTLFAAIEMAPYKHAMEKELRRSERRYRDLVENVRDIIYRADAEGRFTYVSPTVAPLLGYGPADLEGSHYLELILPDRRDEAKAFYVAQFADRLDHTYFEFPVEARDGSVVWIGQTVHLEREGGVVTGFHGVARDITERKEAEDRLKHTAEQLAAANAALEQMAITDELTKLYNRRGFLTLAERQIVAARRMRRRCLLFFVDLDGLKRINDTFGHDEGDAAIVRAADVLRDSFRAVDTVARLGGDEFVGLSNVIREEDEAIIRARLDEKLRAANAEDGRAYELSFSVGVRAFEPSEDASLEEILAEADQAMYEEKRRRRALAG